MNTFRTSVDKNFLIQGFFNSLFYTIPIGMFLTACNFMFESVRNYFFDWWIVALPTITILIIGNLYETFWVYQSSGLFIKREKTFRAKQVGYMTSNANLATS